MYLSLVSCQQWCLPKRFELNELHTVPQLLTLQRPLTCRNKKKPQRIQEVSHFCKHTCNFAVLFLEWIDGELAPWPFDI